MTISNEFRLTYFKRAAKRLHILKESQFKFQQFDLNTDYKSIIAKSKNDIDSLHHNCSDKLPKSKDHPTKVDKIEIRGFKQNFISIILSMLSRMFNFLGMTNLSFSNHAYWRVIDKDSFDHTLDNLHTAKKLNKTEDHHLSPKLEGDTSKSVGFIKALKYQISLEYNFNCTDHPFTINNWYNRIQLPSSLNVKGELYLGALPIIALDDPYRNYLFKMLTDRINSVLSMVEPFEMELGCKKPYTFNHLQPVYRETWKKLGIHQHIISTPDYLPVPDDKIKDGVNFLHEQLSGAQNVYVHCKAGRGRSTTIILCYLMQVHRLSFEAAFELIQSSRPQIYLKPKQISAVKAFKI